MLKISFNFDETTKKVSELTVVELNLDEKALATVESNKIQFTKAALEMLKVKSNDRIEISYWNVSNTETFPVIGKPEVFTNAEDGKRITKANAISFRGVQRELLLEYGSIFEIVPFKEGIFKLQAVLTENTDETENKKEITDAEEALIQEVEDLKNLDKVEVEDLPDDDLPF